MIFYFFDKIQPRPHPQRYRGEKPSGVDSVHMVLATWTSVKAPLMLKHVHRFGRNHPKTFANTSLCVVQLSVAVFANI